MQPCWSSFTAPLGGSHWRSGRPDFTHTKVLRRVPLSFTTTSSDFGGAEACALAQAGFADMSRFLMAGFWPVKLTFPVTVAAFASSIAAGAPAAFLVASSLGWVFSDCSLVPPQPAISSAAAIAAANLTFVDFNLHPPDF